MNTRTFGTIFLASMLMIGANANALADQHFPIEAGSWGGKLRRGPTMNSQHLRSLKKGDAVTILERSGEIMNGYPWFRILTSDGQTGYQWGGILCAGDTPVSGTFKTCSVNDNSGTSENSDTEAIEQPQSNTIHFKPGNSATLIEGTVASGKQITYTLSANAGQKMTLNITSFKNNANFRIYPGNVENKPLPGAQSGAAIKHWTGRLPDTGKYIIAVGSKQDQATYQLYVAVHYEPK